jgi:hypothetical protein
MRNAELAPQRRLLAAITLDVPITSESVMDIYYFFFLRSSKYFQLSIPRLCIKPNLKMGEHFSPGHLWNYYSVSYENILHPYHRQLTIFLCYHPFLLIIEVCVPLSSTSAQSFHSSPSPYMQPHPLFAMVYHYRNVHSNLSLALVQLAFPGDLLPQYQHSITIN